MALTLEQDYRDALGQGFSESWLVEISNEGGSGNDVDGTTGDYTIQEGADELYLINNKNGKKYKFNLTEVT